MGVGMILILNESDVDQAIYGLREAGLNAWSMGHTLTRSSDCENHVIIN